MQSAFIKTGQRFTLKTPDPNELPLPSKELLDMQFVLSRLVNLSGAGEQSDEEDFDDPNENIGTAAVRA
jgi:hypothetical protein